MPKNPFVRVLGVALATGACVKAGEQPLPGNPPEPTTVTEPPTFNPPGPVAPPLPTWDEVKSSHPEGATNPPRPVLLVSRDPAACYKEWVGGMMPPDPAEAALDGHVVDTYSQAIALGTRVQCPEGQPEKLIAEYDAWIQGGSPQKEPL